MQRVKTWDFDSLQENNHLNNNFAMMLLGAHDLERTVRVAQCRNASHALQIGETVQQARIEGLHGIHQQTLPKWLHHHEVDPHHVLGS